MNKEVTPNECVDTSLQDTSRTKQAVKGLSRKMTNTINIMFWFKRHAKGDKTKGAIWCRITVNNERCEMGSTSICCKEKEWDTKNKRLRKSYQDFDFANDKLDRIRIDLRNIYNDAEVKKNCLLLRS